MQIIQSTSIINFINDNLCGEDYELVSLFILGRELHQSIECAKWYERLPLCSSRRTGSVPDVRDIRRLQELCDLCDMLAGVG